MVQYRKGFTVTFESTALPLSVLASILLGLAGTYGKAEDAAARGALDRTDRLARSWQRGAKGPLAASDAAPARR